MSVDRICSSILRQMNTRPLRQLQLHPGNEADRQLLFFRPSLSGSFGSCLLLLVTELSTLFFALHGLLT